MVELKSVIDETFNNLKLKIEEEYNTKIKEHFTKISIDVCNDSYSEDEYGKIDIGKIKHPEGRYIIHKIEFDKERDNLDIQNPSQLYCDMTREIWKHLSKLKSCGTMLIDNFGERYVFLKTVHHYTVGYNNASMMRYTNGAHSPNIKGNPHHSVNITNIIDFEYQLIPSKNEYEYPLTNRIIDFVKSQNFPIEDLDTLSKIMASIEIYKKTYNKKEYDELDNLTDKLNNKNEELTTNLNMKTETSLLINSLSEVPIMNILYNKQVFTYFTQFIIEINFYEDDQKNLRLEKVKNSLENIKKIDKSLEIYFLNSDGNLQYQSYGYPLLNKYYLKDDTTTDFILQYVNTKIYEEKITLIFSYDTLINSIHEINIIKNSDILDNLSIPIKILKYFPENDHIHLFKLLHHINEYHTIIGFNKNSELLINIDKSYINNNSDISIYENKKIESLKEYSNYQINNEKNKEGEQIRIKKIEENLEKNKSQLEYGVKQELLGRIEALYKLKNLTRPLGLPLLSIEKLRSMYSKMKSDVLSHSYSYES